MKKVSFYSKARDRHFEVERIIGEFHGEEKGPALVFFGGIHGNESSGVVALLEVMQEIREWKPRLRGSVYAVTGNMIALQKQQRYESVDLNRIWTKERMLKLQNGEVSEAEMNSDEHEQWELYGILKDIFAKHEHQVYCIDLHTTSAPTVPFITLNDTLINRDFATKFPVPVIIGIEEFLIGPLLSWVMEVGYPALAFEAGEHHANESIEYHRSFVWLSLVYGGLIAKGDVPQFGKHHMVLAASNADHGKVFEVYFRRGVQASEQFKMKPGYANLQPIVRGELLATNIEGEIRSPENGRIFMPLYQAQGDDGFFLAREVSAFWLSLSAVLRKVRFEALLTLLPGVQRDTHEKHTLIVDERVAKFLATQIFHLLGFRSKQRQGHQIRFSRREYDVRGVVRKK